MTDFLLPKCPRHPDDFGQSEEHVFCLREDCEWTEELCWEQRVIPLFEDPEQTSVIVRCMRPHGHDEDHFGYKPDGSEFVWVKTFIDNARQRYNAYDDPTSSYIQTMLDRRQYQPSFVTKPADPTGSRDPRAPNPHKMDPEYFRGRYRALYDSKPDPRDDPQAYKAQMVSNYLRDNFKIHSPPIDELLKAAELQVALNSPPPMTIKIDSLAGMTWDDETDKLGSLKIIANGHMPSSWLDEPKTASGVMTLAKPRTDSKPLIFDTETTKPKRDKWDLQFDPKGDIRLLDYDPAFFYSQYVSQHYPKNVVCTVHDEIQMDLTEAELRTRFPTLRLEARIEKNRLKKFHCPDCGHHWIKKFGTPWCQKCDKAVRDPDKR